jgi:hypothetical protein
MRAYVYSYLSDAANADKRDQSEETYDVPLLLNDTWHSDQMKIYRTKPDEVLDASDIKCPGYKNTSTAW